MAWDNMFETLFYGMSFRLLGAFPTFTGQGLDKSLFIPKEILKTKGTVIFFPEGKCVRDDSLNRPKRGAGVLASQFPDMSILPIAISGSYKVDQRPPGSDHHLYGISGLYPPDPYRPNQRFSLIALLLYQGSHTKKKPENDSSGRILIILAYEVSCRTRDECP